MGDISFVPGFVIGSILGSFVKALADRSLGKKTFGGRSYCPSCKTGLRWYDLLPIVSYLILQGRCRYCRKKIGVEYLVVELGMGILIALLFYQTFDNFKFEIFNFYSIFNFKFLIFSFELILKIFFITILAVLFLTDLKKMLIPDRIIKPAIAIALVFLIVLTMFKVGYLYSSLSQNIVGKLLLPPYSDYFQRHAIQAAEPLFYGILMGGLIGSFFLGLIILTRGKGMGGGDVNLGAFMGLVLGFPQALFALMLAFLTGAIFSVGLIILGKKHFGQTIPFGPFLVLGSLIMLYWGNQIVDWYLKLGS
ncbi:MAG: prepilin peptidase [Candidatus Daviesbacteria bacterium]|nr:prepilin peptidase [Candidatus Daviesbacteria bacterium]